MFDWLWPILARGYTNLRDLANALTNTLRAITDTYVALFVRWYTAFAYMLGGIRWAWQSSTALAASLWSMLLRLAFVTLPGIEQRAISTALSIAGAALGASVRQLLQLISQAQNLATSLFHQAMDYATGWISFLRTEAAWARTLLTDVATRVYRLLTNPGALADWIAGHIIQAVFRWIVGNADALARLALSWLLRGTLFGAALLEQVITDVFL